MKCCLCEAPNPVVLEYEQAAVREHDAKWHPIVNGSMVNRHTTPNTEHKIIGAGDLIGCINCGMGDYQLRDGELNKPCRGRVATPNTFIEKEKEAALISLFAVHQCKDPDEVTRAVMSRILDTFITRALTEQIETIRKEVEALKYTTSEPSSTVRVVNATLDAVTDLPSLQVDK